MLWWKRDSSRIMEAHRWMGEDNLLMDDMGKNSMPFLPHMQASRLPRKVTIWEGKEQVTEGEDHATNCLETLDRVDVIHHADTIVDTAAYYLQ